MQIDRLVPATAQPEHSGTPAPPIGVGDADPPGGDAAVKWRAVLTVALAALSLLGQGERSRVDPRLISPSATLRSYWGALRAGDANGAWDCLVDGRHDLPRPGMLWFLPPTDELTLDAFRSLPVTGGRVLVSYEVRFRPTGGGDLRRFRFADELVRMRGEWRIARPIGEASMPEWQPAPRPVDS